MYSCYIFSTNNLIIFRQSTFTFPKNISNHLLSPFNILKFFYKRFESNHSREYRKTGHLGWKISCSHCLSHFIIPALLIHPRSNSRPQRFINPSCLHKGIHFPTSPLEPIQNLFNKITTDANKQLCLLFSSVYSQFFRSLRQFSNQEKVCSTIQRFGSRMFLPIPRKRRLQGKCAEENAT